MKCKVCQRNKNQGENHGAEPGNPVIFSVFSLVDCYKIGFELEQKKNLDLTAQLARVRSILGIAVNEAKP